MNFIALDFETADQKNEAPCAIGIVLVEDNTIVWKYTSLINPEAEFSPYAMLVHGITPLDVADSPLFPEVWSGIHMLFENYPVVAHNATFEHSVLEKVAHRYSIPLPKITYYCTRELFKNNYKNLENYKLDTLCELYNIDLQHHNCLSDSEVAAQLFMILQNDSNCTIRPIGFSPIDFNKKAIKRHSKPTDYQQACVDFDDVPISFLGKTFCFTGCIGNYERSVLEKMTATKGASTSGSVTKKTDYLVVGYEDANVVKDSKLCKSSKIIKAEQLRQDGGQVKIVSDTDFLVALYIAASIPKISEDDLLNAITSLISDDYLDTAQISIKRTSGSTPYDLIVISFAETDFRNDSTKSATLARYKLSGTAPYISFSSQSKLVLEQNNIPYTCVGSDNYLRVDIYTFLELYRNLALDFDKIFLSSFSFTHFDCCDKYLECSNSKKCLHDDYLYASVSCSYKSKLDNGLIFFGTNRNID